MTKFTDWLESKDYNPYPPDHTEKQMKDGPHYPKDKNLISHTEKTQLQVRENLGRLHSRPKGVFQEKDPYLDLWEKLHPDNISTAFRSQAQIDAAFDELQRLARERARIKQFGPEYHD